MEAIREIAFYKDYFDDFFEPLPEKVKNKIDEVLWKTHKTPKKELEKVEKIMNEYFNEQKNDNNGNRK